MDPSCAAGVTELELWAGAECTVNRVNGEYRDQLRLTGHHDRIDDLDPLPSLGVAALRFPLLWERVSPEHPTAQDWRWSDMRMERLLRLGVRPIVGLVHHGSGPRYTSLIDDGFARGLAAHALAVARRYPWVEEWTPVNEPLTTARFTALYGHWHPHARDERLFWLALLNQVDAVRLAMRAIRSVNPAARLIQTDDLGRTYSTNALAEQSAFDNVRRWSTWDLLCGRVTPTHDLWQRLCDLGFEGRLRSMSDDPCPPDVVGINHYLTSDRFLDHRIQRYPERAHGGNAYRAFADVEAVRVLDPAPAGVHGALTEAWERYRLPLALTEVHNGCTRDEQMRWIAEAWRTAQQLRTEGADIRAVTAWALFGSHGWNTLLTAPGLYEVGAYDTRAARPRPTAVATLLRSLTQAHVPPAGATAQGWWRRDIRLLHPAQARAAPLREHAGVAAGMATGGERILIIGGTGTLGRALAAACRHRNLPFALTCRGELDLLDAASIDAALDRHQPWAVANAAGWVRVDDAEVEIEACHMANAEGAMTATRACQERGIPTLNFSSDLVFGDAGQSAFGESDDCRPLSVYGRSKQRMEQMILSLDGRNLVARTAAFFSPYDEHNFAVAVVETLRRGLPFAAARDCVVTPTYVPDLCNAALDLLIDGEAGIWHVTNGEALSWAEFAQRIARSCGLDDSLIEPVASTELGWKAARPVKSALRSDKGCELPSLTWAIERFAHVVAAELVQSRRRV